jgi:crotonobetainyl-CoA:carnitine CoA-transferase CaiB-like acyl-CoA transferase
VLEDPQVAANGYLTDIEHPAGESITLVRAPVQFDEELPELRCAPRAGADTDDILREMGYTAKDVDHFRRLGVIPAAVPLV